MKTNKWGKSFWIETAYARKLRLIALESVRIIGKYDQSTATGRQQAQAELAEYAAKLEPWALLEAANMFDKLNNQDLIMWRRQAKQLSIGLKRVINETPVGAMQRAFVFDQVQLIKTLPLNAGLKAQEYAAKAMIGGARHETLIVDIAKLNDLSVFQARRIARTECAKQSSLLTQARGLNIGATQYIWRTSKDAAVRSSHRHMEGVVCSLIDPPEVEPGKFYQSGCVYNCRCHPEIIIPGIDKKRMLGTKV